MLNVEELRIQARHDEHRRLAELNHQHALKLLDTLVCERCGHHTEDCPCGKVGSQAVVDARHVLSVGYANGSIPKPADPVYRHIAPTTRLADPPRRRKESWERHERHQTHR